jgi:glycosyl transferase family 87
MIKKIIAMLMIGIAIAFLCFAISGEDIANRDYISYWSSGHLLLRHQNPYDPATLFAIQKSVGYTGNHAEMMRNVPIALWLAIPLGVLPARLGAVLWSLGIVALVMISVRLLWAMHGRPPDRVHLLGYLFAPVLATILAGQTSVFLLFGIAAFLRFHKTHRFLAGAALAICCIKPHLFLPFGAVFLLWVLMERSYRTFAGVLCSIAAMLVSSLALRPSIWHDYRTMLGHENLSIPTLSSVLRLAIHPQWMWLQYVPVGFAVCWAVSYFLGRRGEWDWRTHGSLLILTCIVTTPYAWFTDEAVLLPAILAGLYVSSSRAMIVYEVIAGAALLEVLWGLPLFSPFYLWTPLAWMAWYLSATGRTAHLISSSGNSPSRLIPA